MKTFTIFFLTLCSFTAQAQIVAFNNAAQNTFYGIGGYSFTQELFPTGLQPTPYVVSGPSPQNDFSYVITTNGGAITNSAGVISTTNSNNHIFIEMKGNNVRKFACRVYAYVSNAASATNNIINVIATTNLGNTATQTGSNAGQFVGFNVTGNENEYIVSVTAQFQTTPSPAARIALFSIMVGDNTPQNVALNFDGSNDYVSIPSAVGNFATNQDFTVSCWIKPDPNQPTPQGQFYPYDNDIITKRNDQSASISDPYPFEIRYLNVNYPVVADRHKIKVGQWDGTTFKEVTSTTAVNDGKWHHVAFVRELGVFKLYIDGVPEGGNVTDNANNNTTNIHPLQIGRKVNNQNFFKGEIDEVRIWSFGKTATEIANERFCKTPNASNLVVAYNFSNGVPHDNNPLITQVQDAVGTNHGTLNNFDKTGDASNFVTGQVKYVNALVPGNGSSWLSPFNNLHSALTPNACNDLFDVYVAKATYKPAFDDVNFPYTIPAGMRLYGGFAGTEKSINQRNMALIQTTNETTLSGDLAGDDTPFNFTTNRTDNSQNVVVINGSNASLDGFTIRGAGILDGVRLNSGSTNTLIKHNKVIDNNFGIIVKGNNTTIANSIISGNNGDGVRTLNADALTINNSLMANNGRYGVYISLDGTIQTNISNSTIASNGNDGINVNSFGISNNTLKNNLIYGNASAGINTSGLVTYNITYSLVQGVTSGTGNLNGNTVNPQFVSPLGSGFGSLSLSNLGDYRLKDSSPCINVGDDVGVSPLDLDRTPRPKGGKTDMGAYESNVNMNEIISIINGNWESSSTWNLNRQPLATDKVILNGHNVMIGTNLARAKDLEYKTGAILRYVNGGVLRFGM